jgi:hypothetical protein
MDMVSIWSDKILETGSSDGCASVNGFNVILNYS